MKNIHILPTDKTSRLRYNLSNVLALTKEPYRDYGKKVNQHIYITDDEEIKEGDWFYVKTPNIYGGNVIVKSLGFGKNCWSDHILAETTDEKGYHPSHCIKIILTTDQDLINDDVTAIDDEFLEWFVKNPSCEYVMVQKGFADGTAWGYNFLDYKIINLKELPQFGTKEFYTFFSDLCDKNLGGKPKQETLEEAIKQVITDKLKQETLEEGFEIEKIAMDKLKSKWEHLYTFGYPQKPFPTNYENDLNNVKIGLCEGAKWQQKQSYNEQEAFNMLMEFWKEERPEFKTNPVCVSNWFEQNKKK